MTILQTSQKADSRDKYRSKISLTIIQDKDLVSQPASNSHSSANDSLSSTNVNAIISTQKEVDAAEIDELDRLFVWGNIQSEFGAVLTNEVVKLYSRSRNTGYTAVSDNNGYFSFADVTPAEDYSMTVAPNGMFKRVVKEPVSIVLDQTELPIVLHPLLVATLKGKIVNIEGVAIPKYEFKVQSPEKSKWIVRIVTDVIGEFLLEDVPIGELEFIKTFGQALQITGYYFQGDQQAPIELVVDKGLYELNGEVYDQYNDTVAGATVILSWENTNGRMRSTHNRRDTTNQSGQFSFKGIGSGEHELLITAAGDLVGQQIVNVGIDNTDFTIVLTQKPPIE